MSHLVLAHPIIDGKTVWMLAGFAVGLLGAVVAGGFFFVRAMWRWWTKS